MPSREEADQQPAADAVFAAAGMLSVVIDA
jgi:hypothetical protein